MGSLHNNSKTNTCQKCGMMATQTAVSDQETVEKLKRLLETEKLLKNHEELKKEFKKKSMTISQRSRDLVFEKVEKDKRNEKVKAIGRGFSATGSGISCLGAIIIPFAPPAGLVISAFGSGVSVVGHIILGVNKAYRIKAKKGKEKNAKKEFQNFYEDMKSIINRYDESSATIIADLSTYPEINECTNFEKQLDILNGLVERYNKKVDGQKFPFVELHSFVSKLMRIDRKLMKDENTKTTIENIVEETKDKLKEAMDKAVKTQEKADLEPESAKVENRGYVPRKILDVAGPASMIGKPIAETSHLDLVFDVSGVIHKICVHSTAAATTTLENVAEKTAAAGVKFGSPIFGGVTSFIFMCWNGYHSMRAIKEYKALGHLIEKAEDAATPTDQLRVLVENEKCKKLAEKAITIIELADTMMEVLDQAI